MLRTIQRHRGRRLDCALTTALNDLDRTMRTLKAYTCWGTPCSVEIDDVGNMIRAHGTGVRSKSDVLKLADPDRMKPTNSLRLEPSTSRDGAETS